MENNPQYPGVNNCGFNFNDASGATSNDKTLVEQEYEDMINSYGITIKYFVHNYDKYNSANNLVGTDLTKDYNYPVKLKMYINLNQGATSLMKFGYITNDEIEGIITFKSYTENMSSLSAYTLFGQPCKPKEQDIIQLYNFGLDRPLGMDGKYFIITDVTDENPTTNQVGGHYVWTIKATRFKYSYEGVEDNPDGTANVIAEKQNNQVSDNTYFGRLSGSENFPTSNGTTEGVGKTYPYDLNEEGDKIFDYLSANDNTEVYGGYGPQITIESEFFATTENISSLNIVNSNTISSGFIECDMVDEIDNFKQTFQMPVKYQLKYIEIYNPVLSSWEYLSGTISGSITSFTQSIIYKNINGYNEIYKNFVNNSISSISNRILRFYINT